VQPIGSAWQKLPRVVRDLSSELGKKIDLVMLGSALVEGVEADRALLGLARRLALGSRLDAVVGRVAGRSCRGWCATCRRNSARRSTS
jgi:two-component system chemotaxis sensor kinase CheA